MIIKPGRLEPGDTVGVVSPSWGGAGLFPHRVEQGRQALERMGLRLKLGEHALNCRGWASDTPQWRAADLHAMFLDPEVKAIVAAIGGDHSCQLLPHLDFDLIRRHPKIFMGYSDISVLNLAIWSTTGLVTFNGPAFLTDFAEFPHMLPYTEENMVKVLCQPQPASTFTPSACWTEEFLDWGEKKDLERLRSLQLSTGWTWLKPGRAQGRLIGGCLESLDHLRETPYWPDFQDSILFLETSDEVPPPARVDSLLMDYENMGIFRNLKGLLFGRPMRYEESQKELLCQVLLERTAKFDFPIVADMDFGHTAPQLTLPIGCQASIDSEQQTFALVESAVI